MIDHPIAGRRYRITRTHCGSTEVFDATITYSASSALGAAWSIIYTRLDGSIGAAWLRDGGDTVITEEIHDGR
jgi:hypothetical protein